MKKTRPQLLFQTLEEKIQPIIADSREKDATIRIILDKIVNIDKIKIVINDYMFIADETMDQINKTIEKLKKHEPIQYILGECHFGNYRFSVDKNVLIPRSETEQLVQFIKNQHGDQAGDPINILDLCTGCGCIAIVLQQYLKILLYLD